MGTYYANKKDYSQKKWQVVDARGQVVGRLASRVARILMGKNDPEYTPHVDTGNGVIVINAAEVVMTGNKPKDKLYKNYSGYPGGLKQRSFERVMKEDPTYAFKHAVKGTLPKSRLGKKMITHLLIYAGKEHPHAAQKPRAMAVKES